MVDKQYVPPVGDFCVVCTRTSDWAIIGGVCPNGVNPLHDHMAEGLVRTFERSQTLGCTDVCMHSDSKEQRLDLLDKGSGVSWS